MQGSENARDWRKYAEAGIAHLLVDAKADSAAEFFEARRLAEEMGVNKGDLRLIGAFNRLNDFYPGIAGPGLASVLE